MNRPSPFLGGAAAASVLLGVASGYLGISSSAPLAIVEKPYERAAAADAPGEPPRVRTYPAREEKLASPFLPEHPTRERAKRQGPPPMSRDIKRPAEGSVPQPPRRAKRPQAIRLVGVVSSEAGRRAILSVGGRHVLLAEGDTKDGVTLLALTEREATIAAQGGELVLRVGESQ